VRGAKIVSEVTEALPARNTTGGYLVDEFVTKASGPLKAGFAVAGIAVPGALLTAVGEVADLAGRYIKESGGNLNDARAEMEEAARKLRALEKDLNSDGVGDRGPGTRRWRGRSRQGEAQADHAAWQGQGRPPGQGWRQE
jgi:hypothetical protein